MKLMARLDGVLFQAQTNPTTKLMAGLGSGSFKHGPHEQIQIVKRGIYGQAHQDFKLWLIDSIGLIQTLLHAKSIFMGNLNCSLKKGKQQLDNQARGENTRQPLKMKAFVCFGRGAAGNLPHLTGHCDVRGGL